MRPRHNPENINFIYKTFQTVSILTEKTKSFLYPLYFFWAMQCSNCKKEDAWLEIIGTDFICKKCINKHKLMGLVYRTHINTFNILLKQLKPNNYQEFMNITRKQVEGVVNLKKYGIFLKTTNIVELE